VQVDHTTTPLLYPAVQAVVKVMEIQAQVLALPAKVMQAVLTVR
jgi:hypothetical protein